MISPSSAIRTGFVNPNLVIEAAICLIYFFECVRALRAYRLRPVIGRSTIDETDIRFPPTE
jgi:hypothetical protein